MNLLISVCKNNYLIGIYRCCIYLYIYIYIYIYIYSIYKIYNNLQSYIYIYIYIYWHFTTLAFSIKVYMKMMNVITFIIYLLKFQVIIYILAKQLKVH